MTVTTSFYGSENKSKRPRFLFVIVSAGYFLLSFVPILLLDRATLRTLTIEDGYYEGVGALFWLIAAILFMVLFVKHREENNFYFIRTNRNIFFFLLACLFLLAFGEEISWGQRIIGFETPAVLRDVNSQKEFNIHNLYFFSGGGAEGSKKGIVGYFTNVGHLFSIFWFTYCLLIPIAHRTIPKAAEFLNRIALPMVPISIGSLFVLNYVISITLGKLIGEVHDEIREHNYAFLFLVVAIWFTMSYKSNTRSVN